VPAEAEDAVDLRVTVTSPDTVRPKWLGGCATTICPPD